MSTNTPSQLPTQPDSGATTNPVVSPSLVNFYRITKVLDRLATHFLPGNPTDSFDFFNLCLSLSRGIDYALANGEIPQKANELPILMKQMYQRKTDDLSLAAVMVLMISVKNACTNGWFQKEDAEELLTIADEIGKTYCTLGNAIAEPNSCHPAVLTIMERFYPNMKLGRVIVSIEAKPGYGASAVDFHITKNNVQPDKKIYLLVARIDNIETSACLISPQLVNFLLNGKGIDTRTNFRMDPGPQMPTSVTSILKFGTNLLQAVGQFNGHYIVLVAYMSVASLPAPPALPPDYVQPAVSVDSDSDIIEGASRISLKCPISRTRIKTPVKGRSCKHFQCFDFDNFIKINSKRPSWRCPHCNHHVCYTDIRLDRNMIEILEKVGENIVEVIFEADRSWKAGSENDHDMDKIQNKAHDCEMEQIEQQESTCSPDAVSNIVDLTNNDNDLDIMGTCETADRKPFQASVPTGDQIEDNFWAGLYIANSGSGTPTAGVDLPVLAEAVSPVFNQEAEDHDNILSMNSVMHNQLSAQSNLTLMNYTNSLVNEYGRSSLTSRHIHRTPSAIQAVPVQSQTLGAQQNSVTNLDSLITSSPSATPHVSLPNPASADPYNAILSDAERQQLFSQSSLNMPPVSTATQNRVPTVNMSAPTHNRVPPVNTSAATRNREPSQLQNRSYRTSILNQYKNSHLQQTLNPPARQPMQPSNAQRSHIQQGGSQGLAAAANSQQARVMASSHVARQGEQRGPPVQAVSRTDELFNSQPDQNWRPTSRMRGSLSDQQLTDDVRQRLIMPSSQQVQSPRSQGPQPGRTTSQLDALIANSRNAHNNPSKPLDGQLMITPTPGSLEPSKRVAEFIRLAIQLYYPKERCWAVYKHLAIDDRAALFKYFSDNCIWPPHAHALVEKLFHKLASKRLSDLLYDEREEWKKLKGNYRAEWIGEKAWELLVKYWMEDPKFKNRSRANKENRASIIGGHRHTQGCVSVPTHARHLAKQLDRDPYPNEVHRKTHFSQRTCQYVDARASNTQASYDEYVAQFLVRNPGIPSHAEIPDSIKLQLWVKAGGGQQRPDRVYGLGALAGNVVHGNLFRAPVLPESSSARSAELSPEMQAMITRMNEELRNQKQELARKNETEKKLLKQMNVFRKFQKMMTKKFMGGRKSRKTSDSSSPASSNQFSPTPHQMHDDDDDDNDEDDEEEEEEDEEDDSE